jgi:hypothetical protein
LVNKDDTDRENKTSGSSPYLRVSVVKIRFHWVAVAKSATCIEIEAGKGAGSRRAEIEDSRNRNGKERQERQAPKSKIVETSRNMSRYPIVLKDYGIVAYFARRFRYNEQALVYSGLLACSSGLASKHAVYR